MDYYGQTCAIAEYNRKLKQLQIAVEVNVNFEGKPCQHEIRGSNGVDYRISVSSKNTGKYLYTRVFSQYDDVIRHLNKMTRKGVL